MDGTEIPVEPDSEADHAEIEENAQRQYQSCDDIHPLAAERTCMGANGNDGVVVELGEDQFILRITQVFDSYLERLVQFLDLLIVAGMEEHLDGVWPQIQLMMLAVCFDLQVYIHQQVGTHMIIRILNDDLLAGDMPLGPQSEDAHEDVLVEVNVEDNGILIRLIGEEDGDRCQYGSGYKLAKPNGPLVVSRHTHTGVLEDIVDDEH